jgi:hypothetical protein
MDEWLRANGQSVALALAAVPFVVIVFNLDADSAVLLGLLALAALLLLYGVAGHRLREFRSPALGATLDPVEVANEAEEVLAERPAVQVQEVAGKAHLVLPAARVSGVGHVEPARATAKAYDATVVTRSFTADAVIAAKKAVDDTKTPKELADRMVDYVRLADGTKLLEELASLAPDELDAVLKEFRAETEREPDASEHEANDA